LHRITWGKSLSAVANRAARCERPAGDPGPKGIYMDLTLTPRTATVNLLRRR
jgi:hypothetical protein